SPDDSIRIAEEYAHNDTRIRILHNEENSGAGWSRMVGYTNAKGEDITFCDPDDYLPENALEVLYEAITQDKDADICIGDYQRVFSDGSKSEVFRNQLRYGHDKWGFAKSTLKYETPQYLWNKIYKTELFRHPDIIAYKNFSKSSDEFLLFQIIQHCKKVININTVVYYYFDNQQSASYNKNNKNAINAMIISFNYIENIYKNVKEFEPIIHKVKTNKYAKFIMIAENDTDLLKIIFKNNINYLFTPKNLLNHFHKKKALKVFLAYLKSKYKISF